MLGMQLKEAVECERSRTDVRSLIVDCDSVRRPVTSETVREQAELKVCARMDPGVFVASIRGR